MDEPVVEDETAVEPEVPGDPVVEEKSFSIKAKEPVIVALKGAIVALEALSVKDGELEGNEAPVQATEEEKHFADFTAKRKILQDAATVIGEVLAEARQAIEYKG